MTNLAEAALDEAKAHDGARKNAVTAFGQTVAWDDFRKLWRIGDALERLSRDLELSTGYVYGLQHLADMAEDLKTERPRIDSALWNSRFAYRTWRMLERQQHLDREARRRWQAELGGIIGGGIARYAGAFKIPLFTYLYQHRD